MAQRADNPLTGQAAEWLSRRQHGPLAPEDQRAFDAWLDASPHHAVAYARVEATWERTVRLQAAPMPETGRRSGAARRWLPLAAAATLLLAAGGALWLMLQPEVHRTGVGERRTVALSDGSRVELNTASILRVDYSDRGRDVRLQSGEALFHVAKDPQRPFVVHAGNAAVRAVGTVFNVRLRDREMVEVTVTEGVVAVDERQPAPRGEAMSAPPAPRTVEAGKGAMVGPGAVATVSLDSEALQQRTAWRRDLIELRGETLEQAVAEFNRYRTAPLVLGDPRIASIRVGGTFATGESEKFLAALSSGFGVESMEGADGKVYLMPAQQ